MADKEVNIALRTTADTSGVHKIEGGMKILESAASKTSSSVVLSARQIDEAWRKYLDSTKNHATKDMAQISTVAQKEAKNVKGMFRSLWENLGKGAIWGIGEKLVGGISGAVSKAFGGTIDAIKSSFKFETQTTQFKTLVGSIDEARRHMQDLKELGDTPPFGLDEFAEASRALMRMTDGVLGYKKSLEMIGDVAAATGYSMSELGQAVGRMYAFIRDGQPLSRAVQQLRNMGVITPEVAQKLQDLQTAGKSNAEIWTEVEKQLLRYKGAMAETEKTGDGLVGAIQSRWDDIVRAFGKALTEDAKDGLTAVHDAAKELEESGSVEVWAKRALEVFETVKNAAAAVGKALGWIWEGSGLSDVWAVGKGMIQSVGASVTRAAAGIANGEGVLDALSAANSEGGNAFAKAAAKGHWLGKMADKGWLGSGMKWAADDNKAEAEHKVRQEEEIRERVRKEKEAEKAEKARREAEEEQRIKESLAAAQKAQEEEAARKAAEKAAEAAKQAEIKAAQEAARERERLDREAHQKRMDMLKEEIAASESRAGGWRNVAASAQSEFDRAFAMYRDPAQAASAIAEEQDYRNDLKQLHKDANRYGGKWRIDELSRLMAAGDSQGVSDTLEGWRRLKGFTPQVEAMVRASAAERTKTTAEDELRKIEHNTASLAAKVEELLAMKG